MTNIFNYSTLSTISYKDKDRFPENALQLASSFSLFHGAHNLFYR